MPNDLLASELRAELARQRVTQQQLADRIDKSQAWISRRLTGDVQLSDPEVREIAEALGVPVSQFLADEPV